MSDHLGDAVAGLIDGRLSHGERERALSHLAHCQACRLEVEAERHVKASLQALCAPEPGTALRARLLGMAIDPTGPVEPRRVTDPVDVRSRSRARPVRIGRRAGATTPAPTVAPLPTPPAAPGPAPPRLAPTPAGPSRPTPARRAGDSAAPRPFGEAVPSRRAGDPRPAGAPRPAGSPAGGADATRPSSRRRRAHAARRRIGAGGALIVLGLGVVLVLGGPDPVAPPQVDPGADGFVTSYVTTTNGVPLRDPAFGADVLRVLTVPTRLPAGQSR